MLQVLFTIEHVVAKYTVFVFLVFLPVHLYYIFRKLQTSPSLMYNIEVPPFYRQWNGINWNI